MIILKIISDYGYVVELNLLEEHEAFIFILVAILLLTVYIRTKVLKKAVKKNVPITSTQNSFDYVNRDILMQPKKDVDMFEVPFKNFSLSWFYRGFGVLCVLVFYFTVVLCISMQ